MSDRTYYSRRRSAAWPVAPLLALAAFAAPAASFAVTRPQPAHVWNFDQIAEEATLLETDWGTKATAPAKIGPGVIRVANTTSCGPGYALSFAGATGSYVKLGVKPGQFGRRSFTTFFRFRTSTTRANTDLLSNRADGGLGNYFSVRLNSGRVWVELSEDTAGTNYVALRSNRATYNDNQWHTVAIKRDGTTLTLYIDGATGETVTRTTSGIADIKNGQVLMAGSSPIADQYRLWLDGLLDDVRVDKAALSDDDIRWIMAANPGVTQASVGEQQTCVLRTDGEIQCWGAGAGWVDDGPAGPWVQVSVGDAYACGVHADGSGACWGREWYGQRVVGSYTQIAALDYAPRQPTSRYAFGLRDDGTVALLGPDIASAPAGTWSQISSGAIWHCGVTAAGKMRCWGVGVSDPFPGDFSEVRTASNGTCGLRTDGRISCWGTPVAPTGSFTHVARSSEAVCGIQTDGTLACTGPRFTVPVPAGTFTQLSGGLYAFYGVASDATIRVWGNSSTTNAGTFAAAVGQPAQGFGQCFGRRSVSASVAATCALRPNGTLACDQKVGPSSESAPRGAFTQVSGGREHACAVRADGVVLCWGRNDSGQSTPPSGTFVAVSVGGDHTCGLRSDRGIRCWGNDYFKQSSPPSGTFAQVSAGHEHSCAIRTDGTVACWGHDVSGETRPPAGTFVQLSLDHFRSCGLKSNGTPVCWGSSAAAGAENTPPDGKFTRLSTGSSHTCGVREDGSAVCWGSDAAGQLAVPAGRTWKALSAGGDGTCGVNAELQLSCWGNNHFVTKPLPPRLYLTD